MGKVVGYLSMLIFIDLFFIVTGQICSGPLGCSFNSIIFNSILDIGSVTLLDWFGELIGNIGNLFSSGTGIAALAIAIGVTIGTFIVAAELRFFIPIALSLALITPDFVFIASYLISLNAILGTLIMVPIISLYVFIVVDWLRGKD